MGKRSRKRGVPDRSGAGITADTSSRDERDAARQRRAEAMARGDARPGRAARRRAAGRTSFEDRPPAPWGNFPLVEIVVLIALVLLVASFFVGGARRGPMLLAGLALRSLAGRGLWLREGFGRFRSHSALLAGAVAAAGITATCFVGRGGGASAAIVPVVVGGGAFLAAFWLSRQAFMRRAGGVGFRR